jgi:hypothetical protein
MLADIELELVDRLSLLPVISSIAFSPATPKKRFSQ